jgi:hypothetical protein
MTAVLKRRGISKQPLPEHAPGHLHLQQPDEEPFEAERNGDRIDREPQQRSAGIVRQKPPRANALDDCEQKLFPEAETPASYFAGAGMQRKISAGQSRAENPNVRHREFYLNQLFFLYKCFQTPCL